MKVIGLVDVACKMARSLMRPKPHCPSIFLQSSDQMALNGMRHRLKPIMSSEFLIDVVEMIAQRLWTDTERLGDTWSIFSCCKHPQDLQLLR